MNKMKNNYLNKNQNGFTVLEMIVAIVIICIIAGIAIPKFLDMSVSAKRATSKGYLATLRSVTNLYYIDNSFYPYQYSELPLTDNYGNRYTTISDPIEKLDNPWVPKYLSRWPPSIRIGKGDWKSPTGPHEGQTDMKIVDTQPDPKTDHNWEEEIIYVRSDGYIYINCNVIDKEGRAIHEW